MSHGHCGPALPPFIRCPLIRSHMTRSLSKADLRRRALARRHGLPAVAAQAFATHLADVGVDLVERLGAQVVSAYWPIRDEASPLLLLEALASRGIVTALPVVLWPETPLIFRSWRPGEPMLRGSLGIHEPLDSAAEVRPDLVIVPLAAFDRTGHRIGYGAGYYDRTLAPLRQNGRLYAVGIGYAAQEIAKVPDDPHDQRLDYVVTEREVIDCGAGPTNAPSFHR
jgi:5-formyltetrahydrofolate cyclo-ligase